MLANILPADPPDLLNGVKRSNFNFLDHGRVAYQIKRNRKYSNMVAYILHADPPPLCPPIKNTTFPEHNQVAYQSKWNQTCSNMVASILPADPHPLPTLGLKLFFSEHGCVAPNCREPQIQQHGSKYFICIPPPHTHTHVLPHPDPRMGSKVQNYPFSEHDHVAYQHEWNQQCSSMV